jgi:hypothetical protein
MHDAWQLAYLLSVSCSCLQKLIQSNETPTTSGESSLRNDLGRTSRGEVARSRGARRGILWRPVQRWRIGSGTTEGVSSEPGGNEQGPDTVMAAQSSDVEATSGTPLLTPLTCPKAAWPRLDDCWPYANGGGQWWTQNFLGGRTLKTTGLTKHKKEYIHNWPPSKIFTE